MGNPVKKSDFEANPSQVDQEVPTITTLLQRKKLQTVPTPPNPSESATGGGITLEAPPISQQNTDSSQEGAIVIELDIPKTEAGPSLQQEAAVLPAPISLEGESVTSPESSSASDVDVPVVSVNSAAMKDRLERRSQFRMYRWTRENLKAVEGGFPRAIEILIHLGATEIVYFEETKQSEFKAYAAFAERDRMACWTGLQLEIPQTLFETLEQSSQTGSVISLQTNGDWDQTWRRHLLLTPESKILLIPLIPIGINKEVKSNKAVLSVHTPQSGFERICKSIQPLLDALKSG